MANMPTIKDHWKDMADPACRLCGGDGINTYEGDDGLAKERACSCTAAKPKHPEDFNELIARAVAGDAAARAIVAQSSENVLPGQPTNTPDFLLGFAMGVQRQKHADFIRMTAMAANMRTKAQVEAVMSAAKRLRDLPVVTVEVVPDPVPAGPADGQG